jgi:hypothetical protein
MTILTGNGVKFAQLAAQLGACKLQLKGMEHSSGKSVIAHCKRQYKLRGTNEFVVEQLEAMVAGILANQEGKTTAELQKMINEYKYGELQAAFIRGVREQY